MKQRIEVGGAGITVTLVVQPVTSMYGKEMRPGATSVSELPWDEIASVTLSPDGLVIDAINGEFIELSGDAEGFGEAVAQLAGMSGAVVPSPIGREVTLWPPPRIDHSGWGSDTPSSTTLGP